MFWHHVSTLSPSVFAKTINDRIKYSKQFLLFYFMGLKASMLLLFCFNCSFYFLKNQMIYVTNSKVVCFMAQVWHVLLHCKILKVCEIRNKLLINSLSGTPHHSLRKASKDVLFHSFDSFILDSQKDGTAVSGGGGMRQSFGRVCIKKPSLFSGHYTVACVKVAKLFLSPATSAAWPDFPWLLGNFNKTNVQLTEGFWKHHREPFTVNNLTEKSTSTNALPRG